jgi:hypothetical protein
VKEFLRKFLLEDADVDERLILIVSHMRFMILSQVEVGGEAFE